MAASGKPTAAETIVVVPLSRRSGPQTATRQRMDVGNTPSRIGRLLFHCFCLDPEAEAQGEELRRWNQMHGFNSEVSRDCNKTEDWTVVKTLRTLVVCVFAQTVV